jgi:hypothetical protein
VLEGEGGPGKLDLRSISLLLTHQFFLHKYAMFRELLTVRLLPRQFPSCLKHERHVWMIVHTCGHLLVAMCAVWGCLRETRAAKARTLQALVPQL